jgi:MATE family multidrug resistance protein
MQSARSDHAFLNRPHRTLFRLAIPVLFSLVAEPLTGLVDTAFVARLGSVPLAALGVGTMILSALYWVFNFLGIATQTEVAGAEGKGDLSRVAEETGLALTLAALLGAATALLLIPATPTLTAALGAAGNLQADADLYVRIRWLGAPAVIVVVAGFGAFRGMQDMKTPMWIAASIQAVNIVLDWFLIFGHGPFPELGIRGAAIASIAAQWLAAGATVYILRRRLGLRPMLDPTRAKRLFRIGGDLFVRTGMLTLFLLLATRQATRIGAEAGAAHQAIRQFWIFTALFLDSFAISGQSLVAYFRGGGRDAAALQVARVVCTWSLVTGFALAAAMWLGRDAFAALLVPADALARFHAAWWAAIVFQPLNALTFATDGIHWGTGDFRYLRNATVAATLAGGVLLLLLDTGSDLALLQVWIVTGVWILIRTAFGVLRLWPGSVSAPLGSRLRSG